MSRAKIYLKNLAANYVGYGANLLVMFFMSPFVVNSLGDVDYGVWSLMMSLTGYLGLTELGTRAGIGRFINYYMGKKDAEAVNAVMSAGMAIFTAIGGVLLVAAAVLAVTLPYLFPKIPADLVPATQVVVFLIALNLWVGFLVAPFRQLLQAHERFDLLTVTDLVVMTVRTAATVWCLWSGHGLKMLALIQLGSSLLGQVGVYLFARRVFPQLGLRLSMVTRPRLRELFGFSVWAFISDVAWKMLYGLDTMVIAILLGPSSITYYAVAGMLLMRSRELTVQAAMVFSPRMIQNCARGEWATLEADFRHGCNLTMGIGILLVVGMIGFGQEFITLWMGPRFGVSYHILVILCVAAAFDPAMIMTGPIFSGLHRLGVSASVALIQAVVNVAAVLICVVALQMGLIGVAWAGLVSRLGCGVVTVIIALRLMHVSPGRFLVATSGRWLALAAGFLGVCLAVEQLPFEQKWVWFALKVVIAQLFYWPLLWMILLDRKTKDRCRQWGSRAWEGLRLLGQIRHSAVKEAALQTPSKVD
jgi:O-antigen/teichoic acid export membrane protein